MSRAADLRDRAVTWADRSWCRLVQSSAGDQVLEVYQTRPALAEHLAGCFECRQVADGYQRLAAGFDDMQHRSYTAPPDFVDRVINRLGAPVDPLPRRRSPKEKAAIGGAAVVSVAAIVAAVVRRRASAS